MERGKYIVIEGIDGCGKTTQLRKLIDNLRSAGIDCATVYEPGGTPPGQQVREILIGDDLEEYQTPKCQVLGYNYARAMLMETVKRLLDEGVNVFSDRSFLSTIAYQHFGEHEPLEKVREICEYAVGDCMPDHFIILDVSFEEAKRRMLARGGLPNHYDKKSEEFFKRLRDGYVWAAKHYADITTVINGERYENMISVDIFERVLEIIGGVNDVG